MVAKIELGYEIYNSSKNMIAIVDDDEAVRDSLSILLSLSGYEVLAFRSGAELLEMLDSKTLVPKLSCLILDVHMPFMSGLDLVEILNTKGCKIPVILISGNIDVTSKDRATQLGVSRLLEKPFSDDLLFENIRKVTSS